jgi:hypothetical protein
MDIRHRSRMRSLGHTLRDANRIRRNRGRSRQIRRGVLVAANRIRASPFSCNHLFKLKKRWKASAAAIIKRAYDLKLIDAVQYRQSFKYMSAMNWRKSGEPNETEFKGPELFSNALGALGTKIELSIDQVCKNLHFTPETFLTVTGVSVPLSKGKPVEVIPIRATALG